MLNVAGLGLALAVAAAILCRELYRRATAAERRIAALQTQVEWLWVYNACVVHRQGGPLCQNITTDVDAWCEGCRRRVDK